MDINSQDYDGRAALHLAAANGKVNVLDYLLTFEDIEVNVLDRYNGTPVDDSIRHNRDVAKTMLVAHGGLSKYDPQLAERSERLNLEKKDRAKSTRRLRIEDQLLNTPEGRASIWVKGRCGKLIPMALAKATEASLRMRSNLVKNVSVIKKIAPEEVHQDVEKGGTTSNASTYWRVLQNEVMPKRTLSAGRNGDHECDILKSNDQLSVEVQEWLERMYTLYAYISEDLPRSRVVTWSAIEYSRQKSKLLPEICVNISLAKFLLREMTLFKETVHHPEATLLRSTAMAVKLIRQKANSFKTRLRGSGVHMATNLTTSLNRQQMQDDPQEEPDAHEKKLKGLVGLVNKTIFTGIEISLESDASAQEPLPPGQSLIPEVSAGVASMSTLPTQAVDMEVTDYSEGPDGIRPHTYQVETEIDMLIATELEELDAQTKEVVQKQHE